MAAWMKMAMLLAVMILPGGLVFTVGWALGRACMTQFRQATLSGDGRIDVLKALSGIRLRDVWREAREMSGWRPHPTPHH